MRISDVVRPIAGGVKQVGKGITALGMGFLFIMSVIGTLSFDFIILRMISKGNNNSNNSDAFLTGYLWGSLMSNRGPRYSSANHSSGNIVADGAALFIVSLIMTIISVPLSAYLGVPEVGYWLIMGWVGASATLAGGLIIYSAAEQLENLLPPEVAIAELVSSVNNERTFGSSYARVSAQTTTAAATQQKLESAPYEKPTHTHKWRTTTQLPIATPLNLSMPL